MDYRKSRYDRPVPVQSRLNSITWLFAERFNDIVRAAPLLGTVILISFLFVVDERRKKKKKNKKPAARRNDRSNAESQSNKNQCSSLVLRNANEGKNRTPPRRDVFTDNFIPPRWRPTEKNGLSKC